MKHNKAGMTPSEWFSGADLRSVGGEAPQADLRAADDAFRVEKEALI